MDPEAWVAVAVAVVTSGIALWQARVARVQARSAERQVSLMEEERNQAQPRFRVTAAPVDELETRRTATGEVVPTGGSQLMEVQVQVENLSTRNAGIAHSGLLCLADSSEGIDEGVRGQLPHFFLPGEQLSWTIPGSTFLNVLDGLDGDAAEFTVFVDQDHPFGAHSGERRWESQPFTVRRNP